MSEKSFMQRFLLLSLIVLVGASCIFAQKKNKDDGISPDQKSRNVKKEDSVNKIYKKWVGEDVAYIITPEEKAAFNKLQTNEERENFIANFWLRRDPNPDTEENEYKEEYFERIAYANEHFTSGIPGWRTDRGRTYITWGKPDGVEAHPSGGNYDRPSYEGGGSTTTYPFETWFYRHLDGVGEGVEIEFVDPTGTGEYRYARNANEKDALASVPGAGFTTNEQLGLENKGDRITGLSNNNYQREQDSPFRRLEQYINLQKAPQVKFSDLEGLAGGNSGVLEEKNPIEFDLRVDFFRQSENQVITAFTVQAENKELTFEDNGGLQVATMNIFGKITAVSGKRSGVFEDAATVTATAQELAEAKDRKSVYQKAYALQPGTYRVDVVVRDVKSGKTGIIHKGFTVPRYDNEKLSTSTLVLATRLYETTEKDLGGSFIIGDKKVIPNLSGVYKKGQDVGVYLQVYNSGIDQTTLRPAVDVEYVLMKDGEEILKQPENWEGLSDAGQRLTLARLLPTTQLAPGNYEIKIKIHDRVSNQEIEPSDKFTVVQ
ncbi:MAG: GWxTD domain-containing protein [Pyrinomonadaceae bacterium]